MLFGPNKPNLTGVVVAFAFPMSGGQNLKIRRWLNHFTHRKAALVLALAFAACSDIQAADPFVSNVRSAQRAGTKLVDIYYDVADADGDRFAISVAVSTNGGASYDFPPPRSPATWARTSRRARTSASSGTPGQDWPNKFSANLRFRVTASDSTVPPPPSGMVLIPAGSFQMGDTFNDGTPP